jgi:hypothetical protein
LIERVDKLIVEIEPVVLGEIDVVEPTARATVGVVATRISYGIGDFDLLIQSCRVGNITQIDFNCQIWSHEGHEIWQHVVIVVGFRLLVVPIGNKQQVPLTKIHISRDGNRSADGIAGVRNQRPTPRD